MKNIFLVSFFLISIYYTVSAQNRASITTNSLFQLFQNKNPFDVLNEISPSIYDLDYKAIYANTNLKPYLMQLLDKNEYFHYNMERNKSSYINDTSWIRNKIADKLRKQKRIYVLDSVMNNKMLYTQYRDSIMETFMALIIMENKKMHFNNSIPNDAIRFHSLLAIPDSYIIIKKLWEETEKITDRNECFIALVRLGDPEARKLYDDKIKGVVKKNGDPSGMYEIDSELAVLNNSYAIEKMIELFKVNQMYYLGPDGEPYNCLVLSNLVDKIFYHSISIDPSVKRNDPCNTHLKHLPQIRVAAQKLIKKYKEDEYYWMKNMPFYKN